MATNRPNLPYRTLMEPSLLLSIFSSSLHAQSKTVKHVPRCLIVPYVFSLTSCSCSSACNNVMLGFITIKGIACWNVLPIPFRFSPRMSVKPVTVHAKLAPLKPRAYPA